MVEVGDTIEILKDRNSYPYHELQIGQQCTIHRVGNGYIYVSDFDFDIGQWFEVLLYDDEYKIIEKGK